MSEVVSTDVVERPVIVDENGKVFWVTPEMATLPLKDLELIAKIAKGTLAWRKYEVTYVEQPLLCDFRGCYAVVEKGSRYCGQQHIHSK